MTWAVAAVASDRKAHMGRVNFMRTGDLCFILSPVEGLRRIESWWFISG